MNVTILAQYEIVLCNNYSTTIPSPVKVTKEDQASDTRQLRDNILRRSVLPILSPTLNIVVTRTDGDQRSIGTDFFLPPPLKADLTYLRHLLPRHVSKLPVVRTTSMFYLFKASLDEAVSQRIGTRSEEKWSAINASERARLRKSRVNLI